MSIAAHTKADELSINARTACLSVFIFFEDDCASTIAQYKPVAIFIPRSAGCLRIIISLRKRACLAKAAQAERTRCHFAATGDHRIGVAILNETRRQADGVR